METRAHPPGLQDVLEFPLVEALYGRRARRFSLGASLPDGPMGFTSQRDPMALSELEQMLVLTAAAGNTGWHYMIMRHARYAPHLSNYSAGAGSRTFPSAAGFHTSEVFFTDDEGVYLFETRDAPALIERTTEGPPGVFEGYCPPHYPDMRAAVEAFAERKFGPGGPFHSDTPGPWKESARIRSSAQVHSEEFKECVALMAQYIYERFGKFPGTVPSIFVLTYLRTHHLELEFYDHHFGPGAYLQTHSDHMARWHG